MNAMPTSVHDRFLADHLRIERLLEQLLAAFAADDREDIQRLWTDFESSILTHLTAEETYLIPDLRRLREPDALEILAEHENIRTRVAELGAGIDLHSVRLERARAFVDYLRAHSRREDGLYAWADAHLSGQARTSLLGALADAVRVVIGVPLK